MNEFGIKEKREIWIFKNLKKVHNSIIEKRNSSILIMTGGVSFSILAWLVLMNITLRVVGVLNSIFEVLMLILFFIPIFSLYGIVVSVIQIIKKKWIFLQLIGIGLNLIWFLAFVLFCILIISGITV